MIGVRCASVGGCRSNLLITLAARWAIGRDSDCRADHGRPGDLASISTARPYVRGSSRWVCHCREQCSGGILAGAAFSPFPAAVPFRGNISVRSRFTASLQMTCSAAARATNGSRADQLLARAQSRSGAPRPDDMRRRPSSASSPPRCTTQPALPRRKKTPPARSSSPQSQQNCRIA